MRKHEFLYRLEMALDSISKTEREELIHYYEELITDAIENGEIETEFIERLGSIDKIARTIKKDDEFVENVKDKKNFELDQKFNNTVIIIGKILFIIAIIITISIAASLVISGINGMISSLVSFIMSFVSKMSKVTTIYYLGFFLFSAGITMFGVLFSIFIIKESKNKLEQLYEHIDKFFKKGEQIT